MAERKLIFAIKILVYLSIIMPLIVMGSSFIFPFVFPKAIYFRVLVELMVVPYFILCLQNRDYRPRWTLLNKVLCAFFAVLFLSTVFGVDFNRSFWGNHERMSGWYTLIHFGVFSMIVGSVFKKWEEWRVLLSLEAIIGLAVGVTGLNFLLPDKSIMKIGGGGTLGNMIYLANFVLFQIFIGWLLFRREKSRPWRIFALAVMALSLLILIYNGKRGPMIGLLSGAFVGILFYSFLSAVKKWRWVGIGLISFLAIFGTIVFFNRQATWVHKIPVVDRLAAVSFSSGTGATRAIAWQIAYEAWKERPILGWGVENFYYAFNKYYNPRSLEFGYYETWFDRSHNIFLDFLSTTGLLGFLAYLSVFLVIGVMLFFAFRQKKINNDQLVFFSAFFVAYVSQSFFVFDHLSSYLIFFLMLAFLESSIAVSASVVVGQQSNKKDNQNNLPWSGIFISSIAMLFLVFKTNIQPALANNRSMRAQQQMGQNFTVGVELYKQALAAYTPHLTDLRNDLARIMISFAQSPEASKSEVYKQAVKWAIDEQEKNVLQHPLEINSLLLLGQCYGIAGNMEKTATVFKQAQELSPKRQQVAYLLAKTLFSLKDYDGAVAVLKKTVDENPKIADSYWYLALVYHDTGRLAEAGVNLKKALELGKSFENLGELAFVGSFLKRIGDFSQAIVYFEKALQKSTNDSGLLLGLSEMYSLTGNKEKAVEMADRAALYDSTAQEKARKWLK